MMDKILVSGSDSGFGKFVCTKLHAMPWTRATTSGEEAKLRSEGVDAIIHCAFNSAKKVPLTDLAAYYADNVLLTARLLRIPHKLFVFISSVDVYPSDFKLATEDSEVDCTQCSGVY